MPHKDPEKRKRYLEEYRRKNREKILAQKRRHHAESRERLNAISRQYYRDHIDEAKEYRKEYYKKNAEKYRKRSRNRWASMSPEQKDEARKRVLASHSYKNRDTLYPKQIAARKAVRMAVNSKKLPPANSLFCSACGESARHYHHHLGYAKKHHLSVVPLCARCHGIGS